MRWPRSQLGSNRNKILTLNRREAGRLNEVPFRGRFQSLPALRLSPLTYELEDGVTPLRGLTRQVVCREPWIVEAWLPRDYAKWDPTLRRFKAMRIVGGHLALVRSLRDRKRVQMVADWILLACIDAGLEKPA